jgi:hypothetical protein
VTRLEAGGAGMEELGAALGPVAVLEGCGLRGRDDLKIERGERRSVGEAAVKYGAQMRAKAVRPA